MGAIASILLDKGLGVSGSDLVENRITLNLKEKGAKVFLGHKKENIDGADIIVYSSAVKKDNPEVISAKEKNLLVIPRAKLLAELMEEHTGITVAGAHGKTTTTSMVANLLIKAKFCPTTTIGGILKNIDTNASLGKSEYFVSELDESDGSFLYFSPQYSIITNIDREHMDFYLTWESILKAYEDFIRKTKEDGLIIACGDDVNLNNLLKKSNRKFISYGFTQVNDYLALNIKSEGFTTNFDCFKSGEKLGNITLNIPGRHNVLNALAAIVLGLELRIDFNLIKKSLAEFAGVRRRLDVKGQVNDIMVIDDYGHHPTEIKATLAAVNSLRKERLITVFQPHRYTRLFHLMEDFSTSLLDCDFLVITDIYAASEKPIENVSSENLCDKIKEKGNKNVIYLPKDKILSFLLDFIKPGDIVLTLGAGDITKISDQIVDKLNQRLSKKEEKKDER